MSWNSWNVKKFTFNKQNNFISLLMSITISKKSSMLIPVGLRMRKTLKSVLCTNNNDLIATFVNDILGYWWCMNKKPMFCSQKLSGTNGFLYMPFLSFHCRQGFVNVTLPTLHWIVSSNFLQLLTWHILLTYNDFQQKSFIHTTVKLWHFSDHLPCLSATIVH